MDAESFEALRPWLELRGELGMDPVGPVSCTFNGTAVEPSYVRHMCRRLRTKLGLSKRVHAHALRHTHAHELFRGARGDQAGPAAARACAARLDRYVPAEDWRQRGCGGCPRARLVAGGCLSRAKSRQLQ